MASKYTYSRIVSNEYLGKSKEIKASTTYDLKIKVAQQVELYNKQAAAQMERDRVQSLKECADADDKSAQADLDSLNNIFSSVVGANTELHWGKMKRHKSYTAFSFADHEPTESEFFAKFNVPKPSVIEKIISNKRDKRIELETQAKEAYQNAFISYARTKNEAYEKWKSEKIRFEKEQDDFNADIDQFKANYEIGEKASVERYILNVLSNSEYPDYFPQDSEVAFLIDSATAVISIKLPNIDALPKISGYKYNSTKKEIKEILLKPKELAALYDTAIKSMILRTIYEVLSADYKMIIHELVINGWTSGIDKATGNKYDACIISVQITRSTFESINFKCVDPVECIRNLKGQYAGSLAQMAPIKPIMELDTSDHRFIEARAIIDNIREGDNLATMDWEDFEHLVRELFEKFFEKNGAEVKVTQSSRDGGVDAIAFNPDPIVGGKYVIQAKRYNRVVPVSAVRDLYGTMINEGAAKGLLVTTSYFGSDSREFAKDKPISLIDGQNLLAMLSQYGYAAHIELQVGDIQ